MKRYAFFIILLIFSCCKEEVINIPKELKGYLRDSLDIQETIRKKERYVVLDVKIKDSKALLTIAGDGFFEFVYIDLVTKKKIFATTPTERYCQLYTNFDVCGDSLTYFCSFPHIYKVHIKTGKAVKHSLKCSDGTGLPTSIACSEKQTFFYHDNYGVSFCNNLERKLKRLRTYKGTINDRWSIHSIPINDTLNLLSGAMIMPDTMSLSAINHNNETEWTYNIKYPHKTPPENGKIGILSYDNTFIVKHPNGIEALSKKDGKKLWGYSLNNPLEFEEMIYPEETNVFRYQDKVLECRLVQHPEQKYIVNQGTTRVGYRIILKMYQNKTGKEDWSSSLNVSSHHILGIFQDIIVVRDYECIYLLAVKTGKLISKNKIETQDKKKYDFDIVADKVTGKCYINLTNKKIYW